MKPAVPKETRRKALSPQATPSRPRKVPSRSGAAASVAVARTDAPREQVIREAAYFVYLRSGCIDGRDQENWAQAEAEVAQLFAVGEPKGGTLPA